jgi:hypothetical protein
MSLGAYSIVRYSNNLNDQRINLAILVWHPVDGFAHRITPSLDRAQAVDPRVRILALKKQLDFIKGHLSGPPGEGVEILKSLSQQFREGLEVSAPYPARFHSLPEILDELYEKLISPVEEFIRASTQRQFENKVKAALTSALGKVNPKAKCVVMGARQVNGVSVDVGIRTTVRNKSALWHALSLQSKERTVEQITAAKAVAMEIVTIRQHLKDLKNAKQIVVLQPPRPKASEHLSESIAWLRHQADEVIRVGDLASLSQVLETKLQDLVS